MRRDAGRDWRRLGAYTAHIAKWRNQRARGALAQLAPLSKGRKPQERNPLQDQLAQLQREVARLQARLQQAETVIEIQKTVALLLGERQPAWSNNHT